MITDTVATMVASNIGITADKYLPSAIAASTAGAENPTVAETIPPAKPNEGCILCDNK